MGKTTVSQKNHYKTTQTTEAFIRSLTDEQINAVYDPEVPELPARTNEKYVGESFKLKTYENPFVVDEHIIGYPFQLQDAINRYGKQIIPDCLGIYHLFFDEQLVYIGMSTNIRARLLCHLEDQDKVFTHVLWFCADMWKKEATIKEILALERIMIRKHKPVLNQKYTMKN